MYKPFLVQLIKNLEDRFPNINLFDAFTVLAPSTMPYDDSTVIVEHGNEQIEVGS